MKWFAVLLVVAGVGGFFGYRMSREKAAEEAVIESVCAQEIDAVAHVEVAKKLMKDGDVAASGAQALLIKGELERSAILSPHLPALHRLAGKSDAVARAKALAVIAAERCPDVFPEAIKAEKPIGYTIQLSTWTEMN